MKNLFTDLVFLPILLTITLSAPVERGDPWVVTSDPSSRRDTTTQFHVYTCLLHGDFILDIHVEYGTSIHPEASAFMFSATLSKLALDDETITKGHFREGNTQPLTHSHETRHVIISISDSPMWALKQKGVSQDTIPQYVCQNVHVTDPASGDQYQLVPNNSLEKFVSSNSDVVMITLKLK